MKAVWHLPFSLDLLFVGIPRSTGDNYFGKMTTDTTLPLTAGSGKHL